MFKLENLNLVFSKKNGFTVTPYLDYYYTNIYLAYFLVVLIFYLFNVSLFAILLLIFVANLILLKITIDIITSENNMRGIKIFCKDKNNEDYGNVRVSVPCFTTATMIINIFIDLTALIATITSSHFSGTEIGFTLFLIICSFSPFIMISLLFLDYRECLKESKNNSNRLFEELSSYVGTIKADGSYNKSKSGHNTPLYYLIIMIVLTALTVFFSESNIILTMSGAILSLCYSQAIKFRDRFLTAQGKEGIKQFTKYLLAQRVGLVLLTISNGTIVINKLVSEYADLFTKITSWLSKYFTVNNVLLFLLFALTIIFGIVMLAKAYNDIDC